MLGQGGSLGRQRLGHWALLWALCGSLLLSGCGYDEIVHQHQRVSAAWAEVVLQYQRRSDVVPKLLQVIEPMNSGSQGALAPEVLEPMMAAVLAAHAQVAAIVLTPDLSKDEEAFERFNQAQGQLTYVLMRLVRFVDAAAVQPPEAYRMLVAQLGEIEQRIGEARQAYIEDVEAYNALIGAFPRKVTAMVAGYKKRAQFTAELAAARRDAKVQDTKK